MDIQVVGAGGHQKSLELALRRLGYRQPNKKVDANRWAKTLGYNIIVVHVKEFRINSHFIGGGDDKLHCWASEELNRNCDFEEQIATFENYNGMHGASFFPRHGFLTKEEEVEIMFDFL